MFFNKKKKKKRKKKFYLPLIHVSCCQAVTQIEGWWCQDITWLDSEDYDRLLRLVEVKNAFRQISILFSWFEYLSFENMFTDVCHTFWRNPISYTYMICKYFIFLTHECRIESYQFKKLIKAVPKTCSQI